MLFEPRVEGQVERGDDVLDEAPLERVLQAVGDTMPLVLVMVQSSPRQLQSIEWGIAVLDEAGKVELHGEENIWEPEFKLDEAAPHVEPFDSGTPTAPAVELQKQDRPQPDA